MVYEIIKELEAESGTNNKLEILKANSNNRFLREFFRMALNPHITFGIKTIKERELLRFGYHDNKDKLFFGEALAEIYRLYKREFTGHAAMSHLATVLSRCTDEHYDLICRIITKDPACKVGYKLVNKVWKKLIPVTPYMRCASANDKNYARIKYPAMVQKKANGIFLNIIVRDGEVEVQSRNGKVLQLHGKMDCLADLVTNRDFVLHGEGLVRDVKTGRYLDRKTGNGIINKAIQNTITPEEADLIVVEVWDMVQYKHWVDGVTDVTYDKRWAILDQCLTNVMKSWPEISLKIKLVESWYVQNFNEAKDAYNAFLRGGEEGAVLKNLHGIWKNHTSPNQVKMKVKDPADLLCVGTYPHKKNPDWIGGLSLESADGIIKVRTGSGMTEADRQKSPEHYIHKIIELEYNEITDDKTTGQKSLFLPIYQGVRDDKDEADDYPTILERSTNGK